MQYHDNVKSIVENGIRKVEPYHYDRVAHAKARWMGRSLLDVFEKEYRSRNIHYYRRAIENGWITVNGKKATVDTIVRANDSIIHRSHFHEAPVTAQPFCVIHKGDGLLVVDKPGGMPMHPSGRYNYNTAVEILKSTLCLPINRLDRHTSGLVFFALNREHAVKFGRSISQGSVHKEYLCRVLGEFPSGKIVCEQPIKPISFRLSLHYVHIEGKPCVTEFERVSFNGVTSIVKCRPLTGRTHQIRVHLRYLGYPVANDPMYHTTTTPWLPPPLHLMSNEQAQGVTNYLMKQTRYEQHDDTNVCTDCGVLLPTNPAPGTNLGIWLHAWRYYGDGWDYNTEIPAWAHKSFNDPIIPAYL
ncbi:pseudouridine synthase [Fennellomyces sp. T-0311]|nr:pseudouridine synthase [Fennellomyces sp. T-0311]